MQDWLLQLYAAFFGSDVLVAPEYLLVCIPIAWVLYRLQSNRIGFWAWATPKAIYTHKSHWLDLKLFAIGRLMTFFNLFGRVFFTTAVATQVAQWTSGGVVLVSSPLLLALILFLWGDLALYWAHRILHQVKLIWPIHAVHHSAEVMTPFSAYRQHPLGGVVTAISLSLLVGLGQGLLIGALDPGFTVAQIAGVNVFFSVTALLMLNFHHSHIWVRYGRVMEHVFISPAQHQIHHSVEPRHFNKNFGQFLAIWDWMFGTLYIPEGREDIRIGLDAPEDAPLMTHSLWTALWNPLQRMWRIATRRA